MQTSVDLAGFIDQALKDGKLKPGYTWEQLNEALGGKIPPDDEVYIEKKVNNETGRVERIPLLLKKKVLMTGADIVDASANTGQYNEYLVNFEFNSHGAQEFSQITEANLHKRLAIILDNVVQSAPVIQSRISARGQITGSFTPQEAHDLAIVLRAGALPATVKIVQNITVGPTLGADSIKKGLTAGILATLLVVGFMMFLLPLLRTGGRLRPGDQHHLPPGGPVPVRRHPHPAGHRRHHPVGGHGGGLQRPHL